MAERFMVDDAGSLIDMETRTTYDYVSDVVDLLNEQDTRIKELSNELKRYRNIKNVLEDGGVLLTKKQLKSIIEMKMSDVE